MKKTLIFLFSVLLFIGSALHPLAMDRTAHNWYCMHEKEHRRPRVGGELAFAESLGAYYIGSNSEDKVIYLTFDAGYENGNVEKVLNVLREENVKGAFFILSHFVTANPGLVTRMFDEGHTVCNHTAHHRDMTKMSDAEFLAELHELERVCEEKTGKKPAAYYRPPEGRFSEANLSCAKENGYSTVFWSFAYPDWNNDRQPDPAKAARMILDNLHNGEVMLLHPTSATNAAILGEVIRECKAQGYRFGTPDELTAEGRKHDEAQ